MNRYALLLTIFLLMAACAFAQDVINQTGNDTSGNLTAGTNVSVIESPWSPGSKICVFVSEYVRTPVFLILIVIFLAGVAVMSGAAFPQWRNYGYQMVLGPIGAAILYIVGLSALQFLLGTNVCGLLS